MALFGCAFLALWNDVDADVEAQYERWHTNEHVPERVGIPGFLAGRRYRSDAAGQPRYFTLYEVADAVVFDSAAYRDVIDRPTPWSAEMRPRLRSVVRATCTTLAAMGDESQDRVALACARFSCTPDAQPQTEALLAACAGLAGVRSVRIGNALESIPQAFQQWSKSAAPTHVLLIEGDDEGALRAASSGIAAAIAVFGHAREAAIIDAYTLVFKIAHAEVDDSLRRAPPPLTIDANSGH
ncbi:DUF4286 family protein [Burkholderia sp. Ax-1719]|uniref:DUF4286 family protein n=1 Tax=Burkholderia sp. Ax-1719 TaxID=2608334 RepID=UPI0014228DF1|nr:DUF4286 family protein [Burkholderia sp. Ax-1719]NIE63333.1 hypothetical protein [Burkholderia sp. Ax-1719]